MTVTHPRGFVAAGVQCGLKDSKDLAIVANQGPELVGAAVFTRNRVVAAPVKWSRRVIANGEVAAIVVNSGGANACTGDAGYRDAQRMAELTAAVLNVEPDQVAVCSTGLIGTRLDMDCVTRGIRDAAQMLSVDGGLDAAQAIMTTDTVHKQAVVEREGWSIGGMAKGAGMLAPGLATMLVVCTTDAILTADGAQDALEEASRVTFNRADSDGCMSTNDTVMLLANGASGIRPSACELRDALTELCLDLTMQLLADAEGARHRVAIEVTGAASERDAEVVAREVARSNLFKCAVFGKDPNWGRVLASIGVTDAEFDPELLCVSFNGVEVCRNGGIGEPRHKVDMSGSQLHVGINLNAGQSTATVWTNDLTFDYVTINAEYSS